MIMKYFKMLIMYIFSICTKFTKMNIVILILYEEAIRYRRFQFLKKIPFPEMKSFILSCLIKEIHEGNIPIKIYSSLELKEKLKFLNSEKDIKEFSEKEIWINRYENLYIRTIDIPLLIRRIKCY